MSAFIKTVSSHYDKVYVAISNNGVKAVLQGNPYITEIIQYDKKSLFSTLGAICTIRDLKFDAGVSFTPSLSSYLLMWAAGVKLRAGYASDLGGLFLNRTYSADKSHKREHVMEEYKKLLCLVRNDFDFLGAKQLLLPEGNLAWKTRHKWKNVLIAPFASFGKSKMWPMEYYLELISGIIKKSKNIRIYVTGSAQDKMFNLGSGIENNPVFFDMRGAPLTEVMDIARNTDLFIGNDSGIMHIADSFSVPMIVIFGSTAPTWGGPVNSKAELIYKAIECQPCFEKECRFGHYNCLKNIKPDEVLSKVMKFF
jgi:heptosyltransferase-2